MCRVYLQSYSKQPFQFILDHICGHRLEFPAGHSERPASAQLTLCFLGRFIWLVLPKRDPPLLSPCGYLTVPAGDNSAESTKRSHRVPSVCSGQGRERWRRSPDRHKDVFSRQFHRHLINNVKSQREFLK